MTINSAMPPFNKYIQVLEECASKKNEKRFAAKQLLEIHKKVKSLSSPVVLELGVDRGQSTKVILNAMHEKKGSNLISVDIKNCSNVSNLKNWTFIQNDSCNIKQIIKSAPILKKGIDLIYIDSLHTPSHVYKEIYGWFPFLKKDGFMLFDDVESGPYLQGQRKDSIDIETSNRKINQLIEAVFLSNLNVLDLSIIKGSTGLACIKKICSKDYKLKEPKYIRRRHNKFIWKLINLFFRKKEYKHVQKSNNSFLIDVTKY